MTTTLIIIIIISCLPVLRGKFLLHEQVCSVTPSAGKGEVPTPIPPTDPNPSHPVSPGPVPLGFLPVCLRAGKLSACPATDPIRQGLENIGFVVFQGQLNLLGKGRLRPDSHCMLVRAV